MLADDERYEAETRRLLTETHGVRCESCRWEIVRSGGVVGACDEHRGKAERVR